MKKAAWKREYKAQINQEKPLKSQLNITSNGNYPCKLNGLVMLKDVNKLILTSKEVSQKCLKSPFMDQTH